MFPTGVDLFSLWFVGLSYITLMFLLAYYPVKFSLDKIGIQSPSLLKNLIIIFFLGLGSYFLYLILLLILPNINAIFNLPKTSIISNYFLFGVLPTFWLLWASRILGKTLKLSGSSIGKLRGALIFCIIVLFMAVLSYSLEKLLFGFILN